MDILHFYYNCIKLFKVNPLIKNIYKKCKIKMFLLSAEQIQLKETLKSESRKIQNKNKNEQFYVGACNTEWPNVVKTHETLINSFKNNWESTEWNTILTWHRLLSWTKKLVSSQLTWIVLLSLKRKCGYIVETDFVVSLQTTWDKTC